MKKFYIIASLLGLSVLPQFAFASANCPSYPKEDWASEDTLKEALEAEGYKIKKFKIDGNCYEIYGRNKAGKKVEIYFDMKTLAIIKAEVEK
jgi:hypothetical protein